MKYLRLIFYFSFIFTTSCFDFASLVKNVLLFESTTPSMITSSDDGFIYRSFSNASRNGNISTKIERIDLNTGTASHILGSNSSVITNGIGLSARFKSITTLLFVPGSPRKLFVGDYCTIREVNLSTLQVTTVAGDATCISDTDGTGTAAKFTRVNGLAYSNNTLFIATNTQIKQMDMTTYVVTSFVGGSTQGDVDDIGTNARLNPISLTKLGDSLYLIDFNQKIKKISIATGSVTTIAGDNTNPNDDSVDGVGTNATFQFQVNNAITTDNDKILFITEYSKVRKINTLTNEVTTILNSANKLEDIDSDDLNTAKAYLPCGIQYTPQGLFISNVYGLRRFR